MTVRAIPGPPFLPDGTLVSDAFPGRVIKLNLDNTPAGTWTLGDPTRGPLS